MEKNNEIKITKKHVAVGLGKSLGVAALGYLTTAGLSAVFSEKTFGEIIIDSLRPGIVTGTVGLGGILLAAYGYAGSEAYEDWFSNQSEIV